MIYFKWNWKQTAKLSSSYAGIEKYHFHDFLMDE